MTHKEEKLPIALIRDLFDYNASTGDLLWKSPKGGVAKGREAGYINHYGYRRVGIQGMEHAAHRVVWAYHFGKWPDSEIDHLNGVRHDNRIDNLRDVSRRGNNQNKVCHRRGNMFGATMRKDSFRRKPWQAQIVIDGKGVYIGSYATEQEAHEAYLKAASQ